MPLDYQEFYCWSPDDGEAPTRRKPITATDAHAAAAGMVEKRHSDLDYTDSVEVFTLCVETGAFEAVQVDVVPVPQFDTSKVRSPHKWGYAELIATCLIIAVGGEPEWA